MNKKDRIDYFLKYLAKIAIQNPHINFNAYNMEETIYNELKRCSTKDQERRICLDENNGPKESCFEDWLKTYQDKEEIDVYIDMAWQYFCQFVSWNQDALVQSHNIKVYIPLDAGHIRSGAKLIFDFLTKEKISHVSKIGKEITNDNIVIRLVNKEDVERLINFVNSNKFLQEGILEPNPFCFQKDGIALTCDGDYSYNYTVATAIKLYLGKCQSENNLDQVSYESFYDFVVNQYIMEFIEQVPTLFNQAFQLSINQKRENFKQIFQLMIKSQRPDFSFNDFITHYENTIPKETELLLIRAIDKMSQYYQDYDKGLANVKAYIITGKQTHLTKENNLRSMIHNSPMRNEIRKELIERNIKLDDYIKETFAKLDYTPTYNHKTY